MQWKYKGKIFTSSDVPEGAVGFIYQIRFKDGSTYIGKKNFNQTRKRVFGKKEAALVTDKRRKLFEMVTKQSNWMSYTSSSPLVNERIRNGEDYVKNIIKIAFSVKELTYSEVKSMFNFNILEDDSCINDNILGKFFKAEIQKWEQKRK